MAVVLTDEQIEALLAEPKPLPDDFRRRLRLLDKRGHKQRDIGVQGSAGSRFTLILRQSKFNPLDFSVILAYHVQGSNQMVILRRYNGNSHDHTNSIEGDTISGFHVHSATQRYMELGGDDEAYAEPSDGYDGLEAAIQRMIDECGFRLPDAAQRDLKAWMRGDAP